MFNVVAKMTNSRIDVIFVKFVGPVDALKGKRMFVL
jgi:hypothetical protein